MKLNLPEYQFDVKTSNVGQKKQIYDIIRKKFIPLTPEEWVRQHWIRYLIEELDAPASLMSVEVSLKLNNLDKRADLVVYKNSGEPLFLLECKSPSVELKREVFEQAARYRSQIPVKYLCVSNGYEHYCCMFMPDGQYKFIEQMYRYNRW